MSGLARTMALCQAKAPEATAPSASNLVASVAVTPTPLPQAGEEVMSHSGHPARPKPLVPDRSAINIGVLHMRPILLLSRPWPCSRRSRHLRRWRKRRHGRTMSCCSSPMACGPAWSTTDGADMAAIAREGVNLRNSHSLFPTFTTANASAWRPATCSATPATFRNTIYAGFEVPGAGQEPHAVLRERRRCSARSTSISPAIT